MASGIIYKRLADQAAEIASLYGYTLEGHRRRVIYTVCYHRAQCNCNGTSEMLRCVVLHYLGHDYLADPGKLLFDATTNNNLKLVKYFATSDTRITNDTRYMCLIYAAHWKNFEIAAYLLSIGGGESLSILGDVKRYMILCDRTRVRKACRIYFRWIPRCYDLARRSGRRMRVRSYQVYRRLSIC